jgi:HK97 family phage prohead protease
MTVPLSSPATLAEAAFAPLDFKSVGADGHFEGYASLFGREDLGRDVVVAGAFRETLATKGPRDVKLLFQHDPAEPIGLWEILREDAKGLFARGRLMTELARGREVLALMRAGVLDGLSIGFRAVRARRDTRTGIRRIEKADLWEISIVTFPMLPDARVSRVKAKPFMRTRPTARELERWLTQDAGLSRTEARALLRAGLKGFDGARDAAIDAETDGDPLVRKLEAAARLLRRL